MEHETDKPLSPLLSPDEEEFLLSIKRDYEKSRWIRMSGLLSLFLGIGIGITPYVMEADDVYLLVGIFFVCVGILTIRDSVRTQKLYTILKKFLPSNMEL
jgi:hypothetical protein